MARKVLFTLALGALIAFAGASAALGAVTSSVDVSNKLTVATDAADAIVIACVAGNVLITAANPDTGAATCASITAIEVSGGTAGHTISLAGVTAAQFTALTSTVLTGTAGNDGITGSDVGDSIDGGPGNDIITGGPGDDLITPGLGNDNLVFGPSASPEADTLIIPGGHQGDGLDFGSLAADDPLTADLTGATTTLAIHTNRTVAFQAGGVPGTVTRVTGGNGDDIMRAHDGGITLEGGPGDDTLIGGAADDTLDGGAGNDSLTGGPGDDGYPFAAAVAAETDTIVELPNGGNDSLSFNFFSVPPVDVTADLSTLGLTLVTHTNRTVLVGAAGQAPNLEALSTSNGNDVLIGNGAPNSLSSSGGNDRIEGRGGNDILFAGEGDNTSIGGKGDDIYGFEFDLDGLAATQVVSESAGGGRDQIQLLGMPAWIVNLASSDTLLATSSEGSVLTEQAGQARHFEEVITGPGDDQITGNNADNWIDAGSGNNAVAGGRGDDTYQFSQPFEPTHDVITELPGEGDDLLDFFSLGGTRLLAGAAAMLGPPSVSVNLASATTAIGTNGTRSLSVANAGQATNLENVRGTRGDDQITGNDADNRLEGGEGNDVLGGGKGDDLLIGGAGSDMLRGQQGDDVYRFAAATRGVIETDTLREARGGGDDTLDFSELGPGRGVEIDLSTPASAIGGTVARNVRVEARKMTGYLEHVFGGRGADVLSGNSAPNTLIGGPGNDRLQGRGGNDTLLGGAASDRLQGGGGSDSLSGGTGVDIANGGSGDDVLDGGSGNDRLQGNAGNDRADGGRGADTLIGGAGADALLGGRGSDTLVARDGTSDGLNGGPGRDTARIDAGLDRIARIERFV